MAGILDVAAAWRLREWDSAFFGIRIAQVGISRVASDDLARVVSDADAAGIDCIYFLADAADAGTVRAAERNGFSLVDVRLTLVCEIAGGGGSASAIGPGENATHEPRAAGAGRDGAAWGGMRIRAAGSSDVPDLTALARTSHRNTRFYRDPRFDRERCDDLYATWIERSVAGELADVVWVVEIEGAPRGYLTIRADSGTPESGSSASTIGLVAVDPAYRGRGYGDALLRKACEWTAERGFTRATVVTQGTNAVAVRMYERAGFAASHVELWYHRWRQVQC